MRVIRVGLAPAAMLVMLTVATTPARAQDADDAAFAGGQGPLVTRFSGTTQELRDDGKHLVYHVPFEPVAGLDPAAIRWRVARVWIDTLVEPGLVAAFVPALDASSDRPRLAVAVDFALFRRPATYVVEVELTAPPAALDAATPPAPDLPPGTVDPGDVAKQAPPPPDVRRQVVRLSLTHPGATLRPTGTWILWRTRGLLGTELSPATLPLGETSRRARLSSIAIAQYDAAKHGDRAVSGTLVVTAPGEIAPGDVGVARVALRGEFPRGTTTGTIELRAPQLAEPVSIAYEVRDRLAGWFVIPIFLVAGLLGWLFRVFLKQREEVLALCVQADDVLVRIDELLPELGDGARVDLDEARKALVEARGKREPTALTAAIAAAASALTTAGASRATARSALVTAARAGVEVLERPWRLPPGFDLGAARLHFTAAVEHALADRLGDAVTARREADAAIAALVARAATWRRKVADRLEAIEQPATPLPTETVAAWTAPAARMRTALDAVPGDNPGDQPTADAFLRALHAAQAEVVAGTADLAEAIRDLAARVGLALGATATATAQAALVAAAARVDETVARTDAAQALTDVATAAAGFAAATRAAIATVFTAADRAELDELFAQGDYLGAVRAATPRPAGGRRDVAIEESPPAAPGSTAWAPLGGGVSFQPAASRDPVAAPTGARPAEVVVIAPRQREIRARRARDLRSLLATRLLRGSLSTVIVTAGAYFLYGDTFIGTAREIWGLMAIAFTTEFTIEAALDSLAGARATAPQPPA